MSTPKGWLRLSLLSLCMAFIRHLLLVDTASVPQRICKPSDFGAAADGFTLDTVAVLKSIAACSSGGRVVFDAGKVYRLGEVTITGFGVHLEVPKGTQLLASSERADYGPHQDGWYLLHFYHCSGCSLSGAGVVQGPARAFVDASTSPAGIINWRDPSCRSRKQCRPRLLGVRESSGVQISGVNFRDSAFWTLHIRDSEDVHVRDVTVKGDVDFPNNDGVDIDGSSNVTLSGSTISTADDALCIKATSGGQQATRHVLVSNCTLQSRSAAVKLGSESRADMYNITFRNLLVLESNRGLAIQLRDYGAVHSVTFEHVRMTVRCFPGNWWGGGEPIYVTATPRWLGSRVGRLSNITFRDIIAESHGGVVVLAGSPESLVTGISLQDVRIRLTPRAAPGAALRPPPATDNDDRTSAVARDSAAAPLGPVHIHTVTRPMKPHTMQLSVKLDLRPGPYDVRNVVAAAPVVAQFVRGLALLNVSFEVVSPALESGGQGAFRFGQEEREQDNGGGQEASRAWFQELVQHTVEVAEATQVEVQVVPQTDLTASLGDTQSAYNVSKAIGRAQQWKLVLRVVAGWWHDRGDWRPQLMWIGITAGFTITVATLAFIVARLVEGYQSCACPAFASRASDIKQA